MKAWLGVHIMSDNQGLLNALEAATLNRLSGGGLWDSGVDGFGRGVDVITGIEEINISLFFDDFNERTSFRSALGGINGFIQVALPGSYIKGSKCWHDDVLPNGAPRYKDELEFEEVVE
jgi:hypothetical protein